MIQELKDKINQKLPGEIAHRELLPLGRNLEPTKGVLPKKSAVLATLFLDPLTNDWNILFIERAQGGSHSGQIAFPGGKVETQDQSLWQTAIRETEEEVGLSKTIIEKVGTLSSVYIPVSNYMVQPYIGHINLDTYPKLINQPSEVASSFWIPVHYLHEKSVLKTKNIKTSHGVTLKNVPYFDLNNTTVWGATALILNEIRILTKDLL